MNSNNNLDNETILNGEFYFNVMLHVFILFTILHLFFKFYISKITTTAIANEFKHIINDVFKNIDKEKFLKNIDNYKSSFDNLSDLFKNQEKIDSSLPIISFLKDKYNINNIDNLVNAVSSEGKMLPQQNIKDSLTSIDSQKLNDMANLYAKNFNLEYYTNIFSKSDINRENVNNIVFKNIIFVNVLIFIILILFTFIMVKSNILTYTQMSHVILENCITFFFVAIIEVLFFTNIASKFIPALPSTIFTSLLTSLKNHYN
jgi:hypothetical protein